MHSSAQKKAAEARAREVLLMCDIIDRRRLPTSTDVSDYSIDSPVKVLLVSEEERREQEKSATKTKVLSDRRPKNHTTLSTTARCVDELLCADDYRKMMKTMRENALLKSDKLNTEITSLQLELANSKFELEQCRLALRHADKAKEELRRVMLCQGEENSIVTKKMQDLCAERDALLLENKLLKESSQESYPLTTMPKSLQTAEKKRFGGFSTRLQALQVRCVAEDSFDMTLLSEGTESMSSDDNSQEGDVIFEVKSLGFRASTMRKC